MCISSTGVTYPISYMSIYLRETKTISTFSCTSEQSSESGFSPSAVAAPTPFSRRCDHPLEIHKYRLSFFLSRERERDAAKECGRRKEKLMLGRFQSPQPFSAFSAFSSIPRYASSRLRLVLYLSRLLASLPITLTAAVAPASVLWYLLFSLSQHPPRSRSRPRLIK